MTAKRRVLVIDDSLVVRRVLSELVAQHPDLELAAVAATGEIALAKLETMTVDVVTLDVEMPGMGGLGTLVELRRRYPRLPIIMFSSATARAAAITFEALSKGATDYVTKPSMAGSREAALAHVASQLIPKLRALAPVTAAPAAAAPVRPVTPLHRQIRPANADLEIIVVGASTGGPNAISSLCGQLTRLTVPLVIVQHMPPLFTTMFAQRLSAEGKIPFVEVTAPTDAEPGRGYIAPGDHHLRVTRGPRGLRLTVDRGPPENSVRPAVDVLFRTAAAVSGPHVLGVVLTGMGQDGLKGSEEIRNAGGRVIAQDEASSVVWGMPGAVVRGGFAEAMPLAAIAQELRDPRPRSGRHAG